MNSTCLILLTALFDFRIFNLTYYIIWFLIFNWMDFYIWFHSVWFGWLLYLISLCFIWLTILLDFLKFILTDYFFYSPIFNWINFYIWFPYVWFGRLLYLISLCFIWLTTLFDSNIFEFVWLCHNFESCGAWGTFPLVLIKDFNFMQNHFLLVILQLLISQSKISLNNPSFELFHLLSTDINLCEHIWTLFNLIFNLTISVDLSNFC